LIRPWIIVDTKSETQLQNLVSVSNTDVQTDFLESASIILQILIPNPLRCRCQHWTSSWPPIWFRM